MTQDTTTPLGAVARGLAAGVAGTAAMTVYQTAVAKVRGDVPVIGRGLSFGTLVWSASLIELPAMKLAPPVWKYPPVELVLDVSYHLVYGAAGAGAYAALSR